MADLKEAAKSIFLETLESIEIGAIINEKVKVKGYHLTIQDKEICLAGYEEIVLIGLGKASIKMGAAVENLLGSRIKNGILVTDRRADVKLKTEIIEAGHPLPNSNSLLAGRRIIDLIESCGSRSLIIFLISGGGSSLVEVPYWDDVTLRDIQQLNRSLTGCGATISQINIIRKHLSRIKGGRLGYLARKSRCLGLYISDVNPGDLCSIASNPLLPDEASLEDFFEIVNEFAITDQLPQSLARHIKEKDIPELPKDWPAKEQPRLSVLLLENKDALELAAKTAESRGFHVEMDFDSVEGKYEYVANDLINRLLRLRTEKPGKRICLISGGEASCPVKGDGIGGRNHEFVLYSAGRLIDLGIDEGVAVLSCGTDGIDGNSNAAGAVIDGNVARVAMQQGLVLSNYIARSDSHSFLKRAGGVVITGPTGNNIRDVRILLAE